MGRPKKIPQTLRWIVLVNTDEVWSFKLFDQKQEAVDHIKNRLESGWAREDIQVFEGTQLKIRATTSVVVDGITVD